MSVSRRFTGGPAPILVRQYLRHRYEKWRLFVPISGDGLGPDLPKVILNEQCHFFPAPLRGCFFCAGLSWRLYIIGMGPRVMPLIFESGYQKLAIYTIGDRAKHRLASSDGRWTSKLGGKLDISHVLSGLEGKEYGNVVFETKNRKTRTSLGESAK